MNNQENIDGLIAVAKGAIAPGDIRPGGELRPDAASKLTSLVFGCDFLKQVTTRPMKTLKADGVVIDIPSRSLRRVEVGKEPSDKDLTGIENFAYELTAESAELFTDVGISWLRDNQNSPQLLQDIEAGFGNRITGELVDLAFNGEGSGSDPFLKLNKGWIKVASSNDKSAKVDFDVAADGTGWVAGLAKVIKAMPSQFMSSAALIMNPVDMFQYGYEVGVFTKDKDAIAREKQTSILGYKIVSCEYVPTGTVLFTPPKNLIFGLNQDITRYRTFKERKKVIEYTWHMFVDFEIAAKQAVVLGAANFVEAAEPAEAETAA